MPLLATEHRCTELLLFPSQESLWNDFGDPVFDRVGLASFKNSANGFSLTEAALPLFAFYCFFSSFSLWVGAVGLGSSD